MKDLRAHRVLPVGILYISFRKGEGHSGHVRSGWDQIRFSLPFVGFLTYIITVSWFQVYSIHRSYKK